MGIHPGQLVHTPGDSVSITTKLPLTTSLLSVFSIAPASISYIMHLDLVTLFLCLWEYRLIESRTCLIQSWLPRSGAVLAHGLLLIPVSRYCMSEWMADTNKYILHQHSSSLNSGTTFFITQISMLSTMPPKKQGKRKAQPL